MEAATILQYRPNGVARDLKTQRTEMIAVFVHDLGGPFYSAFFSELVRGILEVAESHSYAAIATRGAGGTNTALKHLLLEGRVDGAIVLDPLIPDHVIRSTARSSLPIILLDRSLDTPYSCIVRTDHELGAYKATKHLLEQGARSIAFVTGPPDSDISDMRFMGYQRALLASGIPLNPRLIYHGQHTEQSGMLVAEAMLSQGDLPDGVFSGNDEMAIGMLKRFRDLGVRVPGDVLLIGFDDIPLAGYVTPSLSTVHQPMYELGTLATQVLFRVLQGEPSIGPIMLEPELVERETSRRT